MKETAHHRRSRGKAPAAAPAVAETQRKMPEGDLDRCHMRWWELWMGVMDLLQREEPTAYQRVMAKLERHGLVGGSIIVDPEKGASIDHQDAITRQKVPSDTLLVKTRAFLDDREPVALMGRKKYRAPARLMLMAYYGARYVCEQKPKGARLRGASTELCAQELVAAHFGHPLESCKKILKKAMKETTAKEKALFKRSPVLAEIFLFYPPAPRR